MKPDKQIIGVIMWLLLLCFWFLCVDIPLLPLETIIAEGWNINSRSPRELPTCQHVLARYKQFLGQYYCEKLRQTWSFHVWKDLSKPGVWANSLKAPLIKQHCAHYFGYLHFLVPDISSNLLPSLDWIVKMVKAWQTEHGFSAKSQTFYGLQHAECRGSRGRMTIGISACD